MSQPELSRPTIAAGAQKVRFSVYTVMLIIALIALIVACVLLWMELRAYGPWPPWKAR